jgi:porphobilinogen synthase
MYPGTRLRRLRRDGIREMVSETDLSRGDLIFPIFVDENITEKKEIASMPAQFRFPLCEVVDEVKEVADLGIPAVLLFGIPSRKDETGNAAYDEEGVIQTAVRDIKNEHGDDMIVITDVCLCEYTSHGHCGIVRGGEILNDETLEMLGKIAVSHADAGSDVVAPSGMMDGMVQKIREELDKHGFHNTSIMSYAAKYASSLYSPFRDAADSGYKFGDRRTYQMDFSNSNEAIREAMMDIEEGADMIIVKPALAYLDVLYRVKNEFHIPISAYNVSGEYSMIKAASMKGWLDEKKIVHELLVCIKRAGADLIITYFAKDFANALV